MVTEAEKATEALGQCGFTEDHYIEARDGIMGGVRDPDPRVRDVYLGRFLSAANHDLKVAEFLDKKQRLDDGKPTEIPSSLDAIQLRIESLAVNVSLGAGDSARGDSGSPDVIEGVGTPKLAAGDRADDIVVEPEAVADGGRMGEPEV